MPIRMVQDDPNGQEDYNPQDNNDNSGGGSGGGGNWMFLIPIVGWLFKKPKLLLIVALLAAAYFLILKPMMSSNNNATRTTGANFDERKYDSTEVYEALDNSALANNAIPESASLEKFCPPRRNQGEQGSCVAWSAAYAARTIMEASTAGVNAEQVAFSPAYLYNQIHMPNCQGALLPDAMKVMMYKGSVPLRNFPYDPYTCDRTPSEQAHSFASQYRTRGFQRLTVNGDDHKVDLNAIKQYIAKGAPVVIGMMVPKSFMQGMMGEQVWQPEPDDNPDYGTMGGHAMCVIGYDDRLAGGAVQIMNSWGPEWGNNGIGWVRYKDFMRFNKEAYGLYPLEKRGAVAAKPLACSIGMVVEGKQLIPLQSQGNGVFNTTTKVAKGTKFKMYVKNDIECYTYIFGEETNGKVYTLFPYTAKHSPFCGITGVRLFPKDYSMLVDNLGTKDNMVIVTTTQAIDYNNLMKRINSASGSFSQKVKAALGNVLQQNVSYGTDGKFVQFKANGVPDGKAVVSFIEILK
jgi:C1A family cysteine protease